MDALLRAVDAAELVACLGIIVDAKDEQAAAFYAKYDFVELTTTQTLRVAFTPLPVAGPDQGADEVRSEAIDARFTALLEKRGGEWTPLKAADYGAVLIENGQSRFVELEERDDGALLSISVAQQAPKASGPVIAITSMGSLFGGIYLVHDVWKLSAWAMLLVFAVTIALTAAVAIGMLRLAQKEPLRPVLDALVSKVDAALGNDLGITRG